ncbi:nucleotidyltransferase family protein [Cognatitamlana onchidii]|uniref:nucleotidyltransferase family protein n=1 Tax=Cognatitamlana onchidii TaxID=2562860 RepID=UPI0010A6B587|nr:nucleotidyltransferase family protein [Algibacter onchidii]
MAHSSHIAIAILAAGVSTRMGSPKQLLKWGEKSLMHHAIETSKATKTKEIFIVLGANHETISSELKETNVSIIINYEWRQGLGKSIACAARFVMDSNKRVDGLLVVLVDQPFVTTSFLKNMLTNFGTDNKEIVATHYNDYKIGAPALFDKTYFKALSLLSGDEGANSLIKKHSNFVKILKPDFKNYDIDTPEDYKNLSSH